MCTVTLFPTSKRNFILTSNRDEAINRTTLAPEFYTVNDVKMLFPKDAVAGGSWIGISDKNTLICLLNGGVLSHKRKESYKKSRGLVVTDLLQADDLLKSLQDYNCEGIEPFTIIAINWASELGMYEFVWDGKAKHIKPLTESAYIWSSSTLYTPEMKEKRIKWFEDFKSKNEITPQTLLHFHKTAGENDPDVDLILDRGFLQTKSITQISKFDDNSELRYEDLQTKNVHTISFENEVVKSF